MLSGHKILLDKVRSAEQTARDLYKKGAQIGDTIGVLRDAGQAVLERIRQYEADGSRQEAKNAKAEVEPQAETPTEEEPRNTRNTRKGRWAGPTWSEKATVL